MLLLAGLSVAVVGTGYVFASVPLPRDVFAAPTVVLDADGHQLGTLQPQRRREDVAVADLPRHVVDSVLAAEDAGFYHHRGLSLPGLLRAAVRNAAAGEVRQGGSTITQQYVKTALLQDRGRTLERKMREAVLAVKLERTYGKDEILGFYLNTVYFGRGAYGIQAAAEAFYGVGARDLTAQQAAQLAGLIPAPSRLDPLDNPPAAHARYRYVLRRLVELGWLDPLTGDRYAAEPPIPLPRHSAGLAGTAALSMVERELEDLLGAASIHAGLTVRTTLRTGVQHAAEAAYAAGFDPARLASDAEGRKPTGALVAVDPLDGAVRAVVGGPEGEQINLAVDNRRQPGSTFKVFALAAWLEQGRSADSFFDAPSRYTIPDRAGGGDYVVGNDGGADHGAMTLREATRRSVNTVYAQVWEQVGSPAFVQVARGSGVDSPLADGDPSLVLGTAAVTPLEVAEAYNTLAAGGVHHEPHIVGEIRRGPEVLFSRRSRGQRVLSERAAAHVTDVLRGVITSGTGTRAGIGRPAAGKTGTTQDHRDAWFAGYTPHLTAVVWMGHRDDNTPMAGRYTGGSVPAEVWAQFMSRALDGVPPADFPQPQGGLRVVRAAAPATAPTDIPAPAETTSGEATPTETPSPEVTSPGIVPTESSPADVDPGDPNPGDPSPGHPNVGGTDPDGTIRGQPGEGTVSPEPQGSEDPDARDAGPSGAAVPRPAGDIEPGRGGAPQT